MMVDTFLLVGVALATIAQVTIIDVAFIVMVFGILLTMTGAFGDPNLVVVGIVVTIAGVIGMVLGPYSTPLVVGSLIPIVGFLIYYIYRFVEFPGTERPEQTSSAASLHGAKGRITERTTERAGEIKLDGGGFDPHYRCRTKQGTLEVGERAVVIDPGGGNVLTIAPEGSVDEDELVAKRKEDEGWKIVEDLRGFLGRFRDGKSVNQ